MGTPQEKVNRCHHVSHNTEHFRVFGNILFTYPDAVTHLTALPNTIRPPDWGTRKETSKQKQTTKIQAWKAQRVNLALFPLPKLTLNIFDWFLYLRHTHSQIRLPWADQQENLTVDSSINPSPTLHAAAPPPPAPSVMLQPKLHSLRPLNCFCPTSALPRQNLKAHMHLRSKEDRLEQLSFNRN